MSKLVLGRKRYHKTTNRFKDIIFYLEGKKDDVPCEEVLLSLVSQEEIPPRRVLQKKTKNFIKQMAESGAFEEFNQRVRFRASKKGKLPRGYDIFYLIPPSIGGSYDISNMIVTMPEISHLMYEYYWKQLIPFVHKNALQPNGHKMGVAFRKIPKVFTPDDFFDFVLPDERSSFEALLTARLHWRERVQTLALMQEEKKYIFLKLRQALPPPPGMKNEIVRVCPISEVERAAVRSEYQQKRPELVLESLKRGDFDHLSENLKARIISDKGYIPTEANLSCHHIIPRALGGLNKLDNIVWLSTEDHMVLHEKYLNPLYFCIEQMADSDKDVFVQMPIPESVDIPTYIKKGEQFVVRQPKKSLPYVSKFKQKKKHYLHTRRLKGRD